MGAVVAVAALIWFGIWIWRNPGNLRRKWESVKKRARRALGRSTLYSLAETFFNEAAVLWAVFPLLDAIYDRRKGVNQPSYRSIAASWGVALILFCVGWWCGLIAARKIGEEEEEREIWKRLRF